jgi:hypothetical protein
LERNFISLFFDLVAVKIPDDDREWKFDLRHEVGIYVGQPDHSVDAGIVYFPYTGQELIRSNLHLLNISDEAYRQYFSRRHDLRSPLRSAWTDLRDTAGALEVDFERSIFDEEGDSFRLRTS